MWGDGIVNINELIRNTLSPIGLPVVPDKERDGKGEYIAFNYVGEEFENFSDNEPENDYTSVQVHYFTQSNPHKVKKKIVSRLYKAGFDVSVSSILYEDDDDMWHVTFDIGIDGVPDFETEE